MKYAYGTCYNHGQSFYPTVICMQTAKKYYFCAVQLYIAIVSFAIDLPIKIPQANICLLFCDSGVVKYLLSCDRNKCKLFIPMPRLLYHDP